MCESKSGWLPILLCASGVSRVQVNEEGLAYHELVGRLDIDFILDLWGRGSLRWLGLVARMDEEKLPGVFMFGARGRNNDGVRIFQHNASSVAHGHIKFLPEAGLDFGSTDWVRYAQNRKGWHKVVRGEVVDRSEVTLKCWVCGFVANFAGGLGVHQKPYQMIKDGKHFEFDLCGRCFATATTRTLHGRQHGLVCDSCGVSFASAGGLPNHVCWGDERCQKDAKKAALEQKRQERVKSLTFTGEIWGGSYKWRGAACSGT